MTSPHPWSYSLILATVLAGAWALLLATVAAGTGRAQEEVAIRGIVVNGTAGASAPADIPVLLLVKGTDNSLIATSQTTTTPGGRFEFEQVPKEADASYAFSVDYSQVFYGASLTLEDLSQEVQITVYETTQDASIVKVTNQVMVIAGVDTKNREVSAVEFVRLSNTSDRTLLPNLASPEQLSFLRFALPPLSKELDVGSDLPGGDIVSVGSGFALTSAVVPGEHFVDFSFRFPYQGDRITYRQSLPQGADVYQVMVPLELPGVEVTPLLPIPDVDVQGASYRAWEGRDFAPGEGVDLELTNLPQPGLWARLEKSVTDGTFWKIAIPSAVGAMLAFLLLFGALRPNRSAADPLGAPTDGPNPGPARREALIREIAVLDDRHQRGEVEEADYQEQRVDLVSRALENSTVVGAEDEAAERKAPP